MADTPTFSNLHADNSIDTRHSLSFMPVPRKPVTEKRVQASLDVLPADIQFFLSLLVDQFFRSNEEQAAWADSILADMYQDAQGAPEEEEVSPFEDRTPPDYCVTQTILRGPVAISCGKIDKAPNNSSSATNA